MNVLCVVVCVCCCRSLMFYCVCCIVVYYLLLCFVCHDVVLCVVCYIYIYENVDVRCVGFVRVCVAKC